MKENDLIRDLNIKHNAELKSAFNKIQIAEEELNFFFNFASDAFFITDFNGQIKKMNSVLPKILGYNRKFFMSRPIAEVYKEILHPEDMEKAKKALGGALTGQTVSFEIRYRCKDNSYRWFSFKATPVVKRGLIYTVARDVTERKSFEEKLKKSAEEAKDTLESITDAFYALDNQWRFNYINKEAETILLSARSDLGKTREDLLGKNFWELYPGYKETAVWDIYHKAMNQREPGYIEMKAVYCGIDMEINIYPSNKGISVYFRNVTEKNKIVREMARLENLNTIGQMAATIGHEVRNPMTTVRGLLQTLAAKDELGKYENYFKIMIEELDRSNNILKEFLKMSKDKRVDLKFDNLNKIIEKIYPLIQADAVKDNKVILLKLNAIPEIKIDENEIIQLILNLARNGLEAMVPGGTLTIGTYVEGNEVILSIEDSGNGIVGEVLDKLGTPFLTTKDDGTGLGLPVCYSIANRHNAKIDVNTGKSGTTFLVRFQE